MSPISKPRNGNPPPPPADWSQALEFTLFYGIILVLVAGLIVIWMIAGDDEHNTAKSKMRRDFIAQCIEFHSVERCNDLFYYGRTDLGLRSGR